MEWQCAGPDDRPVSAGAALLSAGSRAVTDWTVQVSAYTVPLMSRQHIEKLEHLRLLRRIYHKGKMASRGVVRGFMHFACHITRTLRNYIPSRYGDAIKNEKDAIDRVLHIWISSIRRR